MKYWDMSESETKEPMTMEITKETVCRLLQQIEYQHLPSGGNETHMREVCVPGRYFPIQVEMLTLPNKYRLLHVAIEVAVKALEAQDDEFFKALNEAYDAEQANEDKR